MNELTSLYYPFSRCVNPASMKQMLLVFDRITFVDPVDDAEWRMKLFRDLEMHDEQFTDYRAIDSALPDLLEHGCIRRIDPAEFRTEKNTLATASALSDLQDRRWVDVASKPRHYQMPAINISGAPSWQVFYPKLPEYFLQAITGQREFSDHLLQPGDEYMSWSLSYAAGSAIGIALHLEIAESIGAAPVTDSQLHHRLLLMKLARAEERGRDGSLIPDSAVRLLTTKIATTILEEVLPEECLLSASFDEIIRFRSNTASLRKRFLVDIETRLSQLRTLTEEREWVAAGRQVLTELQSEFREYQAEFSATRDTVWPGIVSSANNALVSGSLGAVAMSYIGGQVTPLSAQSWVPVSASSKACLKRERPQINSRNLRPRACPIYPRFQRRWVSDGTSGIHFPEKIRGQDGTFPNLTQADRNAVP